RRSGRGGVDDAAIGRVQFQFNQTVDFPIPLHLQRVVGYPCPQLFDAVLVETLNVGPDSRNQSLPRGEDDVAYRLLTRDRIGLAFFAFFFRLLALRKFFIDPAHTAPRSIGESK